MYSDTTYIHTDTQHEQHIQTHHIHVDAHVPHNMHTDIIYRHTPHIHLSHMYTLTHIYANTTYRYTTRTTCTYMFLL